MKKFGFIKNILLIIIILTISYSIYICNFQNDDFINWLNTLILTSISVLLALIIAMYIFYFQTDLIEKATKEKYLPLIENSLILIWKNFADLTGIAKIRFRNGEEINLYTYTIQDIIFEQAIFSNVFNTSQTEFLLAMRNNINYNNKVIEMIINMDPSCFKNPHIYKGRFKELEFNNNSSREDIKKTIKLANKYFKFDELDKKIKQNTWLPFPKVSY